MTADNLSQRVSKLSQRLGELRAKCESNPSDATEILFDALESLQASIEELSAAENKLHQQNALSCLTDEKYRTIVETANEGIILVDADSRTTYVNNKFAGMLGYRPEELIGKCITDYFDKEYIAMALSKREERRQYGVKDSYESKLIRKDGSPLWVVVNSSPLLDKDGKFAGSLGMVTDITERKRMEEELSKNERKYRSIVEQTKDGIVLVDETGCIAEWNAGAEKISGLDKANVLGRPVWEIQSSVAIDEAKTPGLVEALRKMAVDILSTGNSPALNRPLEHAIQLPDGTKAMVEETACTIPTEHGFMVCSTMRDITERKRAEECLHESEERFRSAFEDSAIAMALTSLEGQLLKINSAFCQMLLFSESELVGRRFMEFTHPDDMEANLAGVEAIVSGDRPAFQMEKRYIRKDGQVIWGYMSTAPVCNAQGKPLYLVTHVQDITERKLSEDKISQKNIVLNAINRVYGEAIRCETMEDLGRACLDIVESITSSKFSFIGEIGSDDLIYDVAMSNLGWELCTMYDKTGHCRPLCSFKIQGLYSRVLQAGRSLLTNEPSSHPDSIGVPEGHLRLTAFLGVPFIRDGRAVGMIGVANRDGGYRSVDQEILEALTPTILEAIQRKRAEQALKENQTVLKTIIESTPDYISLKDREGRYVMVNSAAAEFLRLQTGISAAEIIGKKDDDILPFEVACRVMDEDRQVITSGEMRSLDQPFTIRNDLRTFSTIKSPYRDIAGNVIGVANVSRDITERKRTEQALRDSEKRMNKAQEIAHLGSWELDLLNNNLSWSDEVYRIFGLQPQEFGATYEAFLDAVHPDDRAAVDAAYSGSLREGRDAYEIDHRIVRKSNGEVRVVHEKCEHIRDGSGRIIRSVGMVHDITERKVAEQALHESEQRFKDAIDNFPNVLVIYDSERRIRYINSKGLQIIGLSEQEVVGRRDEELFPPDMIDSYLPALKHAIESKTPQMLERTRHASMGGQVIIINIIPLLDEKGNVHQILGITHDITERKNAEDALQTTLQRFYTVISSMYASILLVTDEGRIEFANQAFCDLFNLKCSPGDLLNLTSPEIIEKIKNAYLRPNEEVIRIGEIVGRGHPVRGEEIAMSGDRTCLRDFIPIYINGKSYGRLWHHLDITEHKRMEEELRKARDELELRVQERTAELEQANNKLEIINMKLVDEIKWHANAEAELQKAKGEQAAINTELQAAIEEHKKTEEELLKAKEAAEASVRAKAAFLANMSHELRTPMNSIIGFTSILLEEPLSLEYKDRLDNMRMNGEALLALINDILNFSKLEKEKIELEIHPFDLRQRVEESLDMVSTKAAEKGLDLAYTIDSNVPETIITDSARLLQVMANLLSNAVKYTNKGDIVISVSSKPEEEGHEIHFAVQDTGIGMPQDQMSKLFQPFSQIDTAPSRLNEGTGLGLAISKKLVELMGGRIWAESEEGKGSTFLFTIKAKAAPVDKAARFPAGPQPELAKRNVLIVDDNKTMRRLFGHQTKSWGMMPLVVSLSYSAIELIQKGVVPDVAIIDVGMPDLNGIILAEKIRMYKKDMPLIMLTSIRQHIPEDLSAVSLTKPVKPMQLYDALTSVLAGRPIRGQDQAANQMSISPLRILLAEDNVSSQKVTLRMLGKLGYRADVAANGVEVIQALERQQYDVVLMDIKMPEVDGFEAARQIRQRWPDNGPRIIAMTAYVLEGYSEKCTEASMDDYIGKPVKMDDLADALSRCPPPKNKI